MRQICRILYRVFLGAGLSIILFSSVWAQEKEALKFISLEHDFGVIKEDGGPVEHEFRFINQGEKELMITTVRASCGCTTPGWSKEAIMPGDTGFVKAQYNPLNRPGPFNKTLTVASTASKMSIALRIKGNVKPRSRTPADDFPLKIGNVRFQSKVINMGKVLSNKPVTKTITIYNEGEDTVRFNDQTLAPDHVTVTFDSAVLIPQEKSSISITFDPIKRDDLGYSNEQLVLFTDELTESKKTFSIVATTQEYFPPMTAEEREMAPRMRIDPLDYDFGSIKKGDSLAIDFIMVNDGKEDLMIRKTDATCPCTRVEMETNTIKPGESEVLRVIFDSSGRKGYQYKTISVFSNDPTQPTRVLTIKGKVIE